MSTCVICTEKLKPGATVCPMCGTTVTVGALPVAETIPAPTTGLPPVARLTRTAPLAPDARLCPSCGKTYDASYADSFCVCGTELLRAEQLIAVAAVEQAAAVPPAAMGPQRPPPGTRCLVLYGPDKQPLRYFPLEKDATLIGRLDVVEGNFPDIDVTEWVDPQTARKVSRKHALVLRWRSTNSFTLRPLAGNTGTQLDADMVLPLADYPLEPGRRIILGGAVRFKFEIT